MPTSILPKDRIPEQPYPPGLDDRAGVEIRLIGDVEISVRREHDADGIIEAAGKGRDRAARFIHPAQSCQKMRSRTDADQAKEGEGREIPGGGKLS